MKKNETLTFNKINLSDFNCYYSGRQLFRKPQKMVDFYSVLGRNGDLSISQDRYSNIIRPIECFINSNFIDNYNGLINALSSVDGYARFESTEEPDVYMEAQFNAEIQPDLWQYNDKGIFTLEFNFKPQKWLKMGEEAIHITATKTLLNPTSQKAKPLIKVGGTGTITINGITMTLSTNTGITTIDCETLNCYEGTTNRNGDLSVPNGFPVLTSGENSISVTGCTIDLIPRWWRL